MSDKGQIKGNQAPAIRAKNADLNEFVLEKSIFSNIFDKDIKRVFIYKKAERLAKAIHLIAPAFREAPSLRDRLDAIAVGMVDAAILPPTAARGALSRELLALSSVLSIARTSGMLSAMNAELIATEAHTLLQEVAAYEEPRLFLDESPSLAELVRSQPNVSHARAPHVEVPVPAKGRGVKRSPRAAASTGTDKGHKGQVKDNTANARRDAILDVIRTKGEVYIKDVSTVIRDVSEKTIQRELAALVEEGVLTRKGSRRWTSYALAN
ncbi:MAG TPA: DeoR family transcriptional regulator [Candidatus Paceibacterota bacterium]